MLNYSKVLTGIAAGLCAAVAAGPALADKIKHPVAIFAGLDKITGRIISFEVNIDETVQFGSLHVTPRVCYTRPPTEAPHTTGFVEVEEIEKENQFKKIFSGWMFAASPGLSAAEHPVYDVWLTDCKGGSEIIREARQVEDTPADPGGRALNAPPAAGTGKPAEPAGQRPPRAARQNPNANPAGAPGQPAPLPGAVPGQPLPQRPQQAQRPIPPAPIPQQRAQEPRRAPSQSFFPTGPAAPRNNDIFQGN